MPIPCLRVATFTTRIVCATLGVSTRESQDSSRSTAHVSPSSRAPTPPVPGNLALANFPNMGGRSVLLPCQAVLMLNIALSPSSSGCISFSSFACQQCQRALINRLP